MSAHTATSAVYPYIHALTKSKPTTSCTTASVASAIYHRGSVINILAKSMRRRTIELQFLMILYRNVKVTYSKSI